MTAESFRDTIFSTIYYKCKRFSIRGKIWHATLILKDMPSVPAFSPAVPVKRFTYTTAGMTELIRFSNLKHAYQCIFSPDERFLCVKTTDGLILIYSTEKLDLIQNLCYGKGVGGEDGGFCYSEDGQTIYVIENTEPGMSQLIAFNTQNFEKSVIFTNDSIILKNADHLNGDLFLSAIIFNRVEDSVFYSEDIIIKLSGDKVTGVRYPQQNYGKIFETSLHEIRRGEIAEQYETLPEISFPFKGNDPLDEASIYVWFAGLDESAAEISSLKYNPKGGQDLD